MSDKKNNLIKGAAILGIAGLVGKIIGAFYRVALFDILKSGGMAYYEMAYPIYAFLLVISSAGLPTAISKMVSEKVALDDYRGAHRIFQISFKALIVIGIITTGILFLGADAYASVAHLNEAVYALRAIAPSLLIVSIISAYRGYFQGLQLMTPTAVSQLIEQLGKLFIGFSLAAYFMQYGAQYGAMGALLGLTISEFLALLLLMLIYKRNKRKIKKKVKHSSVPASLEPSNSILKRIIVVAVPITIGASIMPLVQMLDTVIVMNRLMSAGFTQKAAQSLFGVFNGTITSIINMPAVISLALGMSLVPAIASSLAKGDVKESKLKASVGIKLAIMFGVPCAVGMYVLALPILNLLFRSLTISELPIATGLLQIMAFAILCLTLVQVVTSILQGYGKYMTPVKNLMIGAVIKLIVSFVLVGNPEVNIMGAAIGTLACYGTAAVLNIIQAFRVAKVKFSFGDYIVKPVIAAIAMAIVLYIFFPLSKMLVGSNIACLLSVIIGAVVYLAVVLLTGGLQPEDMEFFPGGGKLYGLLLRLGVWKNKGLRRK